MKNCILLLVLLCLPKLLCSQIRGGETRFDKFGQPIQQLDSLSTDEIDVELSGKTFYKDYKIISHAIQLMLIQRLPLVKRINLTLGEKIILNYYLFIIKDKHSIV